MDKAIAKKLETDQDFRQKIEKLAKDYVALGTNALSYYTADFDYSYDLLHNFSALNKSDLENLERGHPKRFILPIASTQIVTISTYVAQTLFGSDTPHKTLPRGPEDEVGSEFMNQLLRWNAEQHPLYTLGYLWATDCLTANRGIFYNSWETVFGTEIKTEDVRDPESPDEAPTFYQRTRMVRKPVGGFSRISYVSPYDFFCDSTIPMHRFQEGRFAGHRVTIPLIELERRAKLDPSNPAYVLPSAVEALKNKKAKNAGVATSLNPTAASPPSGQATTMVSRSAYERNRAGSPLTTNVADKDDGGIVNCHVLWVRLIPRDYELYSAEDIDDPVIFQILIGNDEHALNFSESTYAHFEFPYSVAEAKPNGQYQFAPSWMMTLAPVQNYIDYLKNRHQEALARTTGNLFILDPSALDIEDFQNPEKEGLMIPLKETAQGKKIGDVFQQVAIKDLTENFPLEMQNFIGFAEAASGATSQIQGMAQGDASATEFASSQQMAAGRLSAIARMLSTQALVPQAKQIVSNFQQFLELPQAVRFVPTDATPDQFLGVAGMLITRDMISGSFDFVSHDGTLPGTDGKKVAALTRLLEVAGNPMLGPLIFSPAPGNLDAKKIVFEAARAAGVNVEKFKFRPQDIAQQMQQMAPTGAPSGPGGPPSPANTPSGAPPGPAPEDGPASPGLPPLDLGSGTATPKGVRPANSPI